MSENINPAIRRELENYATNLHWQIILSEPTWKMIEAMARSICISEGYNYPDEDWRYYSNGKITEAAIPDLILEPGEEQRWRNYIRHAKSAFKTAIDTALLESSIPPRIGIVTITKV